jgi:NADH-quinone oxidoreductase subunit L
VFPVAEGHHDFALVAISVAAGLIGIGFAYLLYIARPGLTGAIATTLGGFYRLVYGKYFVDEIYDATVTRPIVAGSTALLWKGVDTGVIDGAANGLGTWAQRTGNVLRLLQSGNIRSYATWVALGAILVLMTLGLAGGAR